MSEHRKLKDGAFYWVRPAEGMGWEPAHFLDGAFYYLGHHQDGPAAEVGAELVPPEE